MAALGVCSDYSTHMRWSTCQLTIKRHSRQTLTLRTSTVKPESLLRFFWNFGMIMCRKFTDGYLATYLYAHLYTDISNRVRDNVSQ